MLNTSIQERLPVASKLIKVAGILISILALGYIIEFVILACLRMFYPFELEWIEGAYVDEARWIAQGHFPYQPPNIYFIPTSKTPLFFYLSAGLMKLLGVGFTAPRLISVLSTLGCFLLLFMIVKKESGAYLPGIVAAGIYAASFRFAGAWMDLAKTDSLFLVLLISAFFVGQSFKHWWGMLASGVLFVLAYYTKQLALPVILVLAPISLIVSRGRNWLQWLSVSMLGLVVFWGLDRLSNGWFSFYTFDTVARHERVTDWLMFWKIFLPKMWPGLVLVVVYIVSLILKTQPFQWKRLEKDWERLAFSAALIVTSWAIFLKEWTYDNDLLPASLGMALLIGLATSLVVVPGEWSFLKFFDNKTLALIFKSGLILLVIAQFAFLFYNPLDQLPARSNRLATDAFIRRLGSLPGEVLFFNHGFANYQAGKTTYLQSAPYYDVINSSNEPSESETYLRKEQVEAVFQQAQQNQRFDWVILDIKKGDWPPYYIQVENVNEDSESFYPVTGAPMQPKSLLAKNPFAYGGQLPLNQDLYEKLFVEGWSPPEKWGRRLVGDRSVVRIAIVRAAYQISIEMHPICIDGHPIVSDVIVGWNDQVLGKNEFTTCEPDSFKFDLRKNLVKKKGYNDLWFKCERAVSEPNANPNGGVDSPNVIVTSIDFIKN